MDAAEELLDVDQIIDRAYVERRLDDWFRRLDRLYADIDCWLPEGWSTADGGTVRIYDDMMQRFDIPAQQCPVRTLLRQHEPAGRLEPRGLWIIGANGRVDLIAPSKHHIINDRSESFEKPKWRIADFNDRFHEVELTADSFERALR